MKKIIFLNNFPRENGVKGEEFKGNEEVKAELLGRGIIGEGEIVEESEPAKAGNDKKSTDLEAKVTTLTEKVSGLETEKSNLEGEKTTLTEKVDELEAEKTTLLEAIKGLDEKANADAMKKAITALKKTAKV